jgi:hypothetical protein
LSTKDFSAVAMIVLKKKPKSTKCSDRHTISFTAHTVKIAARIIRRRFEMEIEGVPGEE